MEGKIPVERIVQACVEQIRAILNTVNEEQAAMNNSVATNHPQDHRGELSEDTATPMATPMSTTHQSEHRGGNVAESSTMALATPMDTSMAVTTQSNHAGDDAAEGSSTATEAETIPPHLEMVINNCSYDPKQQDIDISGKTAFDYLKEVGGLPRMVWCYLHIPGEEKGIRAKYPKLLEAPAKRQLQWTKDGLERFSIEKMKFNVIGLLLYVSGDEVKDKTCVVNRIRATKNVDEDDQANDPKPQNDDDPKPQNDKTEPKKNNNNKKKRKANGNQETAEESEEEPEEEPKKESRKCEVMWKGCVIGSTDAILEETSKFRVLIRIVTQSSNRVILIRNYTEGACANCYYNGNQTRCSLAGGYRATKADGGDNGGDKKRAKTARRTRANGKQAAKSTD
ncbi:hypothetical protein SUNI508_02765 [Seiridium unicorne]|uniref:Uncharacterized protein n=1 Tax=Seiridium unicorne TaxID=138068 RepID=A0ABR2VHJ8_9PEZI